MSRARVGRGLGHRIVRALPARLEARITRIYREGHRRLRPARWGNLRRMAPFSANYGSSRGTPVGRVYIERFLDEHAAHIRGRVLEVREDRYASAFGGPSVGAVEIVDIDASNGEATLIADLGAVNSLPGARYDAVVCTQTLHYLADPVVGCANMWQSLRPGGTMLLSVPGLSRLEDPDTGFVDRLRFAPAGLEHVVREGCPGSRELTVASYGNLTVALANLLGLAAEELKPHEFDVRDPRYPIVVCAVVVKPSLDT